MGAPTVGRFWGYMSVGCLVGLFALALGCARRAEGGRSAGYRLLLAALFGGAEVALTAFPAVDSPSR